ncbi:MAG: NUDIX domain-containing protein [Eubacteriales bacterium]
MPLRYIPFEFCPICATPLESIKIEGKLRKKCPKCHYTHWGEYSIGVGGVLIKENKGLLVQRALNPGKGKWTIPGGYVDQDEKIEDAVVREIREETGLITKPASVIAIKDRPEDITGIKHNIYIVFLLQYLKGEIEPDPKEVKAAGFYSPDECCNLNIAPLSLHMIEKALEFSDKGYTEPGFIRNDTIDIIGAISKLYTLR